jgi:ubiquinone/menaquinone biosynthesis C-methylase UbiE
MDFKDIQSGAQEHHFWFRAKYDVIDMLLKKFQSSEKAKILDVGAGTGQDLKTINLFGDVYAIDLDEKSIALIPDALVVEKKVANVLQIPYPDNYFDLVVAFDVLEHIKEDDVAAKEILRVLKPGGAFVFTVPAFNCIYSSHDKLLNHYRRYNKKMLHALLHDFECKKLGYWFFSLFLPALVVRIFDRNISSRRSFFCIFNRLLYSILKAEHWLLSKGVRFPFGLSIFGTCKKKENVCAKK